MLSMNFKILLICALSIGIVLGAVTERRDDQDEIDLEHVEDEAVEAVTEVPDEPEQCQVNVQVKMVNNKVEHVNH